MDFKALRRCVAVLDKFMNGWIDWQGPIESIFNKYQINNVLEFGLGEGTRFFLDRAKTKSVEFMAQPSHHEWMEKCKEDFKDRKNWELEAIETTDSFNDTVKKAVERNLKGYDFAFVDCGIHCRTDILNMLFGHVPIIAAHDTSFGHEDYGWNNIQGEGYERMDFPEGQGTSVWVKKETLTNKIPV